MACRRAHYVLSTHWDREWYRPFQHFRYALVALLDTVLDGLNNGALPGPFTTDGQAVLLEDYLEVRPERREQIVTLAANGKLVIGPWYVAPDEFLSGGEALIRNLRRGAHVARQLGGQPSRAGLVCDQFGHIGQLPQLLAGFGIHGILLWRGTNEQARHFRWYGSDGTMMPVYRFGRVGYCSFAFDVRRADLSGSSPTRSELTANLAAFIAAEAAATSLPSILLFDGGDHLAWDPQVTEVLQSYAADPAAPVEIVFSDLDSYLDDILPHVDMITTEARGELREPALPPRAENEQYLIPGVLSSRIDLKLANAACEQLLTQWVEPFTAWAHRVAGAPDEAAFLDEGWRWLLLNHPHDSLGGCSIDLVHRDMRYRYSQCRQIGELLTAQALQRLAAAVADSDSNQGRRLVVFNPLPVSVQETVELTIELPPDWPAFAEFFGFESLPAFRIYDADGHEIPYQRLAQHRQRTRFTCFPHTFPDVYQVDEVKVSLPLSLPPLGYTTLTVQPGDLDPLPAHPARRTPAQPIRYPGQGMLIGERRISNGRLTVEVAHDGTLTIHDLVHGQEYQGLLELSDDADIGDGWYHGPALAGNPTVSSTMLSVSVIHNGPFLTTLRVQRQLLVPANFDFNLMQRATHLVELPVTIDLSLRPESDRLEIQLYLCNTAADHRLRLLFPTHAPATTYLADGAFDVVERAISLRPDNYRYRELEVETRPQRSWTAVFADGRGLALIAPGLLETAVLDRPDRAIALTLLRSTRRTVFTDGEPDGLLLNTELHYRMWLLPLSATPDRARLNLLAQQLAGGIQSVHCRQPDYGRLPRTASLLVLEGPLTLSCLRLAATRRIEVRVFNPYETPESGKLHLALPVEAAQPITLAGEALAPPQPLTDRTLHIHCGPKEIQSWWFIIGEEAT